MPSHSSSNPFRHPLSNLFSDLLASTGAMPMARGGLDASGNLLHAVLGTPIGAAPGPDEAEALFGCGCFWGAEKVFWRLPGVMTTAVGYAGGMTASPTYQQV